MYKNYVFDLYGTLVDIRTDEEPERLWRLTADFYSEHGAAYTGRELRREYLRLCEEAQASSPEPYYEIELREVFRALYAAKGVDPDGRLVDGAALFFRKASTIKLRLYPWVSPVFRMLRERGAGIYLLSNAQACFTLPELRELGLDRAFDGLVLSSDAGRRKPDPAIMRRLLDENRLEIRDCLMIGNDRTTDVAVAKSVGMDSLFIKTETSGPYDPDLTATLELTDGDFTHLPALLGL